MTKEPAVTSNGMHPFDTERMSIASTARTAAPIAARQIAPGRTKLKPQFPPRIGLAAQGRDLKVLEVPLPIAWDMDPYDDRNWCAQLHAWHMIDGCFAAFDKRRDPAVLEAARLVALDWLRFHTPRKRRTPQSWGDKIAGHRAGKIAYIVSQWQHGLFPLNAEEQSLMAELARRHLDYLVNRVTVSYSNHTFYQLMGVRALADVVGPDDVRARLLDFVNRHVAALIERQFDAHGMHKEHSFGYQKFGIATLNRLAKTGWFDALALAELAAKAKAIVPWLHTPDGRLAPIGETNEVALANAAEVFPRGRHVFNQSGYCIIRADETGRPTDASYFLMAGAFHSPMHKHADDLAVYWFEGEEILSDPGKYSYNRDARRDYAISTRAHNTVEIDGRNFSTEDADAYGATAIKVSAEDWGYRVSGEVDHKGFGVRHARTCLYAPGEWLLLLDTLSADAEHSYTSWLQLAPHLETVARHGTHLLVPLKSGKTLRILHAGAAAPTITLHRGEMEPRMQGWSGHAYGKLVPSHSIGAHLSGRDVTFATLLVLDGRD